MTRLGSPLRDVRSGAALVAVVASLVFANSLANQFAYDDHHIVVENTAIHSLETLPGALVTPYWPGDHGQELGLWRPTTTAILGLQHIASGGEPKLFHAVNVLGHALASVLVLLLLAQLMSIAAALAAGLVFAVHPVHVEAVANVIGVSEILSTLALVAACLVHVRGSDRSGWTRALAVGSLYAVGFGAKESAVTLPGLIFLVDAARERLAFEDVGAYLRKRWRVYAVMLVVAVALLVGRYQVLGSIANPFGPLGADLLAEIPRIWTISEVWSHYVRLWVFPMDLSSDYSPNVIPISIGWNAGNLVGIAMALMVLAIALIVWRKPAMAKGTDSARAAGFGVGWFVIAISPISNALFLSGVLLAERTLYLPSVGLAAATGWIIVRLHRDRPRVAVALLAAALSLSVARTWTRTPTWYDNATTFTQMVADSPHSGRSQWMLGDVFVGRGMVSQGLVSYRLAVGVLGAHYQLMTEISRKLMEVEHYQSAEALLIYAWKDRPEFALAPSLITAIRAELGDPVGTERFARESIALKQEDPARHHLLAWALAAQGRWTEAREARARGEEQARATFWQAYMYQAYERLQAGDMPGATAAVDSAWAQVNSETGRAVLDSIRVEDFSLEPLLPTRTEAEVSEN